MHFALERKVSQLYYFINSSLLIVFTNSASLSLLHFFFSFTYSLLLTERSIIFRTTLPPSFLLPSFLPSFLLQPFTSSVCSWTCVGHGKNTWTSVLQFEVFISKFFSVNGFATGSVLSGEVTSLTHKVLDNTVKWGALVSKSWKNIEQTNEVNGWSRKEGRKEGRRKEGGKVVRKMMERSVRRSE